MATPIRPWAAGDYRKQPVPDRQNPQRPGYSPTELMALPIAVNPHYPFLYPYTDDDNKTSALPSTTLSSPLAPSPAASIPEPKAKTSQGKKNKNKSAQSMNHDAGNGALVMAYHVNGVPMQVPASGLPHGQVLHYPQYSPYPQQAYQEICSACAGPVFQGPDGTYQPHLCPALQASYAARPASPLPGTSAMFVPRYPGELPPPEMAAGGSWAGYQYSHPGAVYEQYPQPYEYESAGVIVMPPVQAAYPQAAMGRPMPAQMTPAMAAPLPSARGRVSPSLEFRQPSPSPAQTMNKPKFPSVAPSQDQIAKSSSLPNLAAFHQKRASAPPSSRSTPSPPPGPQTLSQAVPTSSRSTPSPPPGPASSVTNSSRSTPSPPPGPASSVSSSKSTPSPPPGSALSVTNSSRSTPSPPPGAQTSVSQAASGVAKLSRSTPSPPPGSAFNVTVTNSSRSTPSPPPGAQAAGSQAAVVANSSRSTPSPPPGQLTNAAKPAQAPQPTQSPASDTQAASQPTTGPGSDGSTQRKGTNSKGTRAGPSPVSSPPSANSSLSKSPPPEASPTQTLQFLQRPSTASVVQESQNTGGDPPPSGSVRSTTPPASTASLSVQTPGVQVQQAHDLLVSIAPQRPRTPTQHKPRALPTPPGHPPAQAKDSPAMARDPKTASAALPASASAQPHTSTSTEPGQQALLPTPSVSASSQAASETEQKSGTPPTHEAPSASAVTPQENPAQCQEPATPTASTASKPEQDATPADAKQQTAAKRAPGKNFGARRTGFQNPLLPPLPFGQQFVAPQFGGQQFVGQQFVGQQFVGQPFVNQQFGQFGVQAPYMQPQMMQFQRRGAALPAHLMPQPTRTPRPTQGKVKAPNA